MRRFEQGMSYAQYSLGKLYSDGDGVPQDYVLAYQWLNLSASKISQKYREAVIETRDDLAKVMTSDQIAEAQRLAREWKPKK